MLHLRTALLVVLSGMSVPACKGSRTATPPMPAIGSRAKISVSVVGSLTAEDIDAIAALVKREDVDIIDIGQEGKGAEVVTGAFRGDSAKGGWVYTLEKADRGWTITKRGRWTE